MTLSQGQEHFVLPWTWMSPHKPDPKLRQIDVDLSAILIRSDESDRPAPSDNALLTNAYSFPQTDGRPIDYFRVRIGWSGWVNLIFVAVACLVGFFCAPLVFHSPEYLPPSRHGFEEVPYARVDLSDIVSSTPSFAAPQSIQFKMNLPEQRTPRLDWNPSSFGLPAFGHSGDFPSLQTGDRIVDSGSSSSGSSPLHSTGFASATMSENTGSNGQSKSGEQQIMGKVTATRPKVFRRHAQTSSAASQKRISSGRQNFLASLFSGTRDATGGKSIAQSRQQSSSSVKLNARNQQRSVHALQIGSSRTVINNSMRSPQMSFGAMQNPADASVMRMQNTMMSQAAFHGGGGLGGLGGGLGNLSAGARR